MKSRDPAESWEPKIGGGDGIFGGGKRPERRPGSWGDEWELVGRLSELDTQGIDETEEGKESGIVGIALGVGIYNNGKISF